MSSFGVTDEGFVKKTLDDIKTEVEDDLKSSISPQLNVLATGLVGQQIGIFADKLREAWDVLEAVYAAQYPDSASKASLDNVSSITGTPRLAATKSTMTVTCTDIVGTDLLAGRVVSVATTGARFVSIADAIIGAGGTVDVAFESEEFGPIAGPAGTLTIETPVSGWATAANALDAVPGRNIESDADFRVRRDLELRAQGDATIEAIRADLGDVDGVTEVFVFENVTGVTDGEGRPLKSIEAIVLGGTDPDVGEALFATKGAGIETFGSTSEVVIDSQGTAHTIRFNRPTVIDIHIAITVVTNTDPLQGPVYPLDGDDQVKAALVAFEVNLGIADDVILEAVKCEAFDVDGVVDITVFLIDTSGPPSGTVNIPIDIREIADLDTSRVTVTSV